MNGLVIADVDVVSPANKVGVVGLAEPNSPLLLPLNDGVVAVLDPPNKLEVVGAVDDGLLPNNVPVVAADGAPDPPNKLEVVGAVDDGLLPNSPVPDVVVAELNIEPEVVGAVADRLLPNCPELGAVLPNKVELGAVVAAVAVSPNSEDVEVLGAVVVGALLPNKVELGVVVAAVAAPNRDGVEVL